MAIIYAPYDLQGKRQLWQSLSTMKLQSKLGRGIKWASIRNLVGKHKIDLLCLQETKRDSSDRALCQAQWGHSDFDWESFPADNTSGGFSVSGIIITSMLIVK